MSGALFVHFWPLLKNFFRRPPSPPPPVRRQKNFGQCTILGVKKRRNTGNTYDVYCHCRCLFIVIPYNRINLNHDRINLNLVGAPNCRGPLVLELTLTTVRYATDDVAGCDKKYLIIITKKRRSICIVFLIHRTPSIKFHPQSWI